MCFFYSEANSSIFIVLVGCIEKTINVKYEGVFDN